MKYFGGYLKSLRENKYSQRELAKLLGVGFPYISKLESGVERFPSEKLLYKIAEVFKIHPSEVFIQAGVLPSDLEQWIMTRSHIYNELLDNMLNENEESKVLTNKISRNVMYKDFNDFFKKSDRIMLLIDPEGGEIFDASDTARLFYGYDAPKFRQLNLSNLNPLSPEELNQNINHVMTRHKNVFNLKHIVKNELKDIIVTSEPITLNGKTLLHSIIIDASTFK